jgi:hypothetical protein
VVIHSGLIKSLGVLVVSIILSLALVEGLFRLEPNMLERLSHRVGANADSREMVAPHVKYGIVGNKAFSGCRAPLNIWTGIIRQEG